ncbi:ATP-binding protein [Ktedonospora formicarum]|uniref:histidine kinase n=1 Tax=Ktedonospora formicarum TaxID=2778364 RepID=A0A8J3MQV9_9CHLR|nr:ATP-binding protein [Ktedonospora formicarum]GHO45297.1 histidine kinase [Ktedonospora formicarum]
MSTSEHQVRGQVDLNNCAKEPIHIPGSIQPHGVLLALSETDFTIMMVSESVQTLFGISAQNLLGQPITTILDDEQFALLQRSLEDIEKSHPLSLTIKHIVFDGALHRADNLLVLELDPAEKSDIPRLNEPNFYRVLRTTVATLRTATTIVPLCQSAADEVRRLTGFDRVMIYRFDAEWNGEVVAEARREDLEPYLGLHYPASDIPQQARELYRRNWLRIIADVDYTPSPVIPTDNPLTGRPLNMSDSILRSVSPIHIEYLKNMGVQASMSVSIIKDDQLWGLISCHHTEPRFVPYGVRLACEFLGHMLSLQLSVLEKTLDYAAEARIRDVQTGLLEAMLSADDVLEALRNEHQKMLELVDAQGIIYSLQGQYVQYGTTPEPAVVHSLLVWLHANMSANIYSTDRLPEVYPAIEKYQDVASGLLAIRISEVENSYVLWFRSEVVQTVTWGGDPNKPVEAIGNEVRLHPRKSFAAWQQAVRGRSLSWLTLQIDAARVIRSGIVDRVLRQVMLQRSTELERLNKELEYSNKELDAFAYITSHDLKEPLRGINNFATILKEDYGDVLDAEGKERLQTMVRLAVRMGEQIEALLHYSRVGRVDMAFGEVNLNDTLARVLDVLNLSIQRARIEIRIPRSLPTVWCDRARIGEVFSNLITNALKYNDKPQKWIEIGYIDPLEQTGDAKRNSTIFYVRDNGIGIREKNYDTIFRIFKRLHGREKYGGGSGAGLTIVKRIIERHKGQIWVESRYGEGTTFYFTLRKG